MNLTPEQQRFAEHPNEAFVQACPGAGKTRTVVARLANIATTLPLRRGVAILSFTNKAIEEFKSRSATEGVGLLLRHPGYIGTFDAFVRHFLFLPTGIVGSSAKPHVVDSWDSLDVEIRLMGRNAFAGDGVSLDLFDPATNLIDPERITNTGLKRHVTEHKLDYERAAQTRRQNLIRQGYFSASDARAVALERIRNEEWGRPLGRAMSARFQEIVVDEAQDCNPLDLEVLTWLRSHGIRVTLVCDMDQSIYAFRDGARTHLEAFANTYEETNRLTLTGNFRSSPAICSLGASLRIREDADIPLGPAREVTHPVALYPYDGRFISSEIGKWFIGHASSAGIDIPVSQLIVLAHSERAARLASGSYVLPPSGKSKIERLACAVSEFWAGTTRHSKSKALSSIEKLLLDITGQRVDSEPVSHTVLRLGLDTRLLRRQALEFAMRLPKTCPDTDADRTAWIDCARNLVTELAILLQQGQTIRTSLPSPRNADWSKHLEQTDVGTGLRYSTIHNAKGSEYAGVCVVIPPDDRRAFTGQLIDAWERRSDHEPKRVIYVGATRAMHLAALAVPTAFVDRCVAILTASGVPHQICT